MGANIIEIPNKIKNLRQHCTASKDPYQFAERNASEGSILDAARTGDNVAR